MKPASIKPVRCAIYTRVSTEQGLDQEFNSLQAQRECGEAYIRSQQQVGWRLHQTELKKWIEATNPLAQLFHGNHITAL